MKKRIGEILIENGSITQEQLKRALELQKELPGKLLGKILVETGSVTEEEIVIALATQFNVPYLPIANFVFNETSEKLIPKNIIQKYLCIPLEKIGNLLTVVMADPTNEQAIREIEEVTKSKVQAFVASASEIMAALQQHFHVDVYASPELGEGRTQGSMSTPTVHKPKNK